MMEILNRKEMSFAVAQPDGCRSESGKSVQRLVPFLRGRGSDDPDTPNGSSTAAAGAVVVDEDLTISRAGAPCGTGSAIAGPDARSLKDRPGALLRCMVCHRFMARNKDLFLCQPAGRRHVTQQSGSVNPVSVCVLSN
jgi:hypothetical protein